MVAIVLSAVALLTGGCSPDTPSTVSGSAASTTTHSAQSPVSGATQSSSQSESTTATSPASVTLRMVPQQVTYPDTRAPVTAADAKVPVLDGAEATVSAKFRNDFIAGLKQDMAAMSQQVQDGMTGSSQISGSGCSGSGSTLTCPTDVHVTTAEGDMYRGRYASVVTAYEYSMLHGTANYASASQTMDLTTGKYLQVSDFTSLSAAAIKAKISYHGVCPRFG